MFQQAFFPIDKTPYAERFVNLQQAVKIDVFQNGSARLWLTTGEEITVTGPSCLPPAASAFGAGMLQASRMTARSMSTAVHSCC
jgi:hypothetical protein